MTHLLQDDTKNRLDTQISLTAAKDVGYYASILLCYLIEATIESSDYGDSNTRLGTKWVPMLPEKHILLDLRIFPDVRTIDRAVKILEEKGYLLVERTGKFLYRGATGFDGYYTGRARDKWPWWHVPKQAKEKSDRRIIISSLEASAYGIPGAVILGYMRNAATAETIDKDEYTKLTATDLEKVLPMDEKTIRRQIKALLESKAIQRHPKKPKLYTIADKSIKVPLKFGKAVKLPRPPKEIAETTPKAEKPVMPDHSSEAPEIVKPAFLDFHAAA